jgi:outer membrane protein assembly factor BamB
MRSTFRPIRDRRAAANRLAAVVLLLSPALRADDWPQWLGPERDGVWRETGIIEKFPDGGPRIRWRAPVGMGYSGPAVAGGRVVVTDRVLPEGVANPANPFDRKSTPGLERVLCLSEADGKLIWKHETECEYTVSYPSGPRTTPVIRDGKVWTLGAEGHLIAFEAEKGKVVWSRDLKKDYGIEAPLWGFAASPLLDGRKLISMVGGNGSTVVAFDKEDGKELWKALSAREPGYCPPVIHEAGGRRQLIIWHPEALSALDPETGAVFWSEPFKVQSGLTIPTPRKLGDLLLVTSFYNGPLMMKLDPMKPAATVLWRGSSSSEKKTDKLHAIMCTPFLEDGHIYGVCSYGQLRCLRADTGERVWETLAPTGATGERGGVNDRWSNAFIVKNGGRFFLSNEKGELIIAKLSPGGYEEVSRARIVEPTNRAMERDVVWSHPAFANRSIYARNDREIVCASLASPVAARAGEPVTLANVTAPPAIGPDEPGLAAHSLEKAARYLDQAALHWQKEKQCGACHTNFVHLMARPALTGVSPPPPEVRAFFEDMVESRWAEKGPRWDAEVACAAVTLAWNDRATTGKLHPATRKALDRMASLQREDGGWDWLLCGWPPMESDDHFGVTFAALGLGAAPEGYAETPAGRKCIDGIRRYLKANPPPSLHHRAMVLWASLEIDGIPGAEEKDRALAELFALQRPDGGWATAALLEGWKEHRRQDDRPQDTTSSDGYATGFIIYLARKAGVPASDPRIERGIRWLQANQRESGRWFTRSPTKDSKHYLSNYGTAFAVMALAACQDTAGD